LKLHSRIDTDADDALLGALLRSARQRCEGMLARKLITQTVRWLPRCLGDGYKLPYPNVQSATVKYYDGAGDLQTVDSDTYRLVNLNDPANDCVLETISGTFPPSLDDRAQPWMVDIVCGYGDSGEFVPEEINLAIKMMVAQWYENREPLVTGTIVAKLPFGLMALMAAHVWSPVV